MADQQVIRFTMSGKEFVFDFDTKLLTGDQTELIRRHIDMSALDFLKAGINITSENFNERVLLMVAFLAEYRGNEYLEWQTFIRTVSPFDLDIVQEPADAADDEAATDQAAEETPAPKKTAPRRRSSTKAASVSS